MSAADCGASAWQLAGGILNIRATIGLHSTDRMKMVSRKGSRPRQVLMLTEQCCLMRAPEWLTLRASCPMRATVEASAAAGLWLLLSGRPKYCASAITVVWPSVRCTCNQRLLLVSKEIMQSDCLRFVMRSHARHVWA